MAQGFKETAHLNTNMNKYRSNYDSINWNLPNKQNKQKEDNESVYVETPNETERTSEVQGVQVQENIG
jgi:hypothetical protein